jgi:hypothetical protein
LLEHHNVKSGLAQGNRCAKPTDASADDYDMPGPGQGSHLLKGSLVSDLTLRAGLAPRIGRFTGHAASRAIDAAR